MAKFKKGDRVRNLEDDGRIFIGAIGTVMENHTRLPLIKWDSEGSLTEYALNTSCYKDNIVLFHNEDSLELIEESPLAEVAAAAKQYIKESKEVGLGEFPQWQEPHIQQQPQESTPLYGGKTEEEWLWIFAGQAMHGLCANPDFTPENGTVGEYAVVKAQSLIEELKKQKQ